jgi:hypothetical protein
MNIQREYVLAPPTDLKPQVPREPQFFQSHSGSIGAIAWRIEKKFAFNRLNGGDALLGGSCVPDSLHPEDWVHTIHFDTADLEAYRQCIDGEFIKKKVRARWYADRPGALPEGPVNLEIKFRRGYATGKKLCGTGQLAVSTPDKLFDPGRWNDIFCNSAFSPLVFAKPLVPVLWSCYRRKRYYDPWSGARLSLDECIQGLAYNWYCNAGKPTLHTVGLNTTVIEVKSQVEQPPPFLQHLAGAQRGYSKYKQLIAAFLRNQL